MKIINFLDDIVRIDVMSKAEKRANDIIQYVVNYYNKSYDDTVEKYYQPNADTKSIMKDFDKIAESWRKIMCPEGSSLCHEVCRHETADMFTKRHGKVYGRGVSSYSYSGKIYRPDKRTPEKIHNWAERKATFHVRFIKQRIIERLKNIHSDITDITIMNAEISDMSIDDSGANSLSWNFFITYKYKNVIYKKQIDTKLIYAGGHNIQKFHVRFLVIVK